MCTYIHGTGLRSLLGDYLGRNMPSEIVNSGGLEISLSVGDCALEAAIEYMHGGSKSECTTDRQTVTV
jgi:hypothetical protein